MVKHDKSAVFPAKPVLQHRSSLYFFNSSCILSKRLYFATRSPRHGAPAFRYPADTATARS